LTGYVRGTVIVAFTDAVLIGAALLLLDVPLWLSLALLTFLGAFVPLLGATVAGAAAVLVTLVTNGQTDAVIVLLVTVAVQQLEGNLLQPFVVGRAVRLHPLAILTAVTAGGLLLGIAGAVIAVPVVAVAYRVTAFLAGHRSPQTDTVARRRSPQSEDDEKGRDSGGDEEDHPEHEPVVPQATRPARGRRSGS